MGKEGIGGVDITYKGQLEGVVHLEGRMREWRVWRVEWGSGGCGGWNGGVEGVEGGMGEWREQKSVGWNGCMKMCRGWSRVEESVE